MKNKNIKYFAWFWGLAGLLLFISGLWHFVFWKYGPKNSDFFYYLANTLVPWQMIPLAYFLFLFIYKKLAKIVALLYIFLTLLNILLIYIGSRTELVLSDWSAIQPPSPESLAVFSLMVIVLVLLSFYNFIIYLIKYLKSKKEDHFSYAMTFLSVIFYGTGGYFMNQGLGGWIYFALSLFMVIAVFIAYIACTNLILKEK